MAGPRRLNAFWRLIVTSGPPYRAALPVLRIGTATLILSGLLALPRVGVTTTVTCRLAALLRSTALATLALRPLRPLLLPRLVSWLGGGLVFPLPVGGGASLLAGALPTLLHLLATQLVVLAGRPLRLPGAMRSLRLLTAWAALPLIAPLILARALVGPLLILAIRPTLVLAGPSRFGVLRLRALLGILWALVG